MATLTTSPQIIGRNEASTIKTYLYAWYDNQSGNTCTVHTLLKAKSVGVTYYGTNKTYFMQLGGYNSGVQSWGYYPMNDGTEYSVAEATQTYSGGEQISASAGFWSYVYGSADIQLSEPVYVPTFVSPPTGLSVSLLEAYTDGAKFRVSISSYGTPSGVSGRYIEAGICAQNTYGATYKYNIALDTMASDITVTNASTRGTLTINPNTRYYYGGYATNTAPYGNTKTIKGQFTTKAEAPTVQFLSATASSASFSYSVEADGGYYDREIQYSLDDGNTWTTRAVVSGASAKTGTFITNNLLSGVAYNMIVRVSTDAGTTLGESVAFNTLVSEEDNKNALYGSADGLAREVRRLYGSVGDTARHITKLYGSAPDPDYFNVTAVERTSNWSVNGVNASTLNNKLKTSHPDIWENRNRFSRIKVDSVPTTPRRYTLTMIYKDNSSIELGYGDESWVNGYGVSVQQPPRPTQPSTDYIVLKNKPISKLVYQAFGHVNYP